MKPLDLYPAIDLKDAKCVRLEQGDMARATIFADDPVAQARAFEEMGFRHLHIVDLDGAFAGAPINRQAVGAVLAATKLKVQLGGGIRDLATIEAWLGAGVHRVILGTAAVNDPDLVREAARLYGAQILVGIDARQGRVAVQGWAETSSIEAHALARRFGDIGIGGIIYTDIERDGMLGGINWQATRDLARAASLPVIASGGFANLDDISALRESADSGVVGAICGRALYDGRLDAQEALSLLAQDL